MFDELYVGKIVHYVMDNEKHRPAIIVDIDNSLTGLVSLQVFTNCKPDFDNKRISYKDKMQSVIWKFQAQFDTSCKKNTWHYIENGQVENNKKTKLSKNNKEKIELERVDIYVEESENI